MLGFTLTLLLAVPAVAQKPKPVEIVNGPGALVPVEVVFDAGIEPYTTGVSATFPMASSFATASTPPVPEGKTFVIEYVSLVVDSNETDPATQIYSPQLRVVTDGTNQTLELASMQPGPRPVLTRRLVLGQSLTLYADPERVIGCQALLAAGGSKANVRCRLVGRMIDAP